jgi:hypothetical protein
MATNKITVKPFEKDPSGQYIEKLSNHLFDYIMPSLSPTAWMVLCFIIRKTVGWKKDSDGLSIGEIKKGTGIKADNTIIKAVGELEEKNYILSDHQKDTRKKNIYSLNTTLKIEVVTTSKNRVVNDKTTVKNEVVTTVKNEVEEPLTTSKNEDSKEQYLNNKGKEHAQENGDYLRTVFEQQGKVTEHTTNNPEDQYFEYRDEFLNTYRDMTGEYPEPLVKDEIGKLITIGITPATWAESWRQCKLNWSGKNKLPLARVIEVCKFGGDYEKWRKSKYPESSNGRDSPEPPKPQLRIVPVSTEAKND